MTCLESLTVFSNTILPRSHCAMHCTIPQFLVLQVYCYATADMEFYMIKVLHWGQSPRCSFFEDHLTREASRLAVLIDQWTNF